MTAPANPPPKSAVATTGGLPLPTALIDLIVVIAVSASVFAVAAALELYETFSRWISPFERYQADELPFALLILAAGLSWYAFRRWREARSELALRIVAEARVGELLRHNRELAHQLISVQESERRALARELHDELGQCLASINAEAAYAGELARERLPALQPCAEAIARTTAHMMEVLQQILHRLRPVGLDEFGLAASLGQMVGDWERRSRGQCSYRLDIDGEVGDLPDNLNVNLYRIVQESLTNAAKHGQARRIDVRLRREPSGAVSLEVEDDGAETGAARGTRAGGFGLIGMHERVQALGGTLAVLPRTPCGVRVEVHLPSPQLDEFTMEAAA